MGKGVTKPPADAGLCRLAFVALVENPVFESFAVAVIFINSVAMGYSGPEPEPGSVADTLSFVVNVTCCIIFTIELLLKFAAYGLWHKDGGLLKSSWCILDLVVVGSTWVDLGVFLSDGKGLSGVQFMRFLRVLRPLRSLHYFGNAQMLIDTFILALPEFASIVCIAMCFITVAALLILNLMGLSGVARYRCFTSVTDPVFGPNYMALLSPQQHCNPEGPTGCPVGSMCKLWPYAFSVNGILDDSSFVDTFFVVISMIYNQGLLLTGTGMAQSYVAIQCMQLRGHSRSHLRYSPAMWIFIISLVAIGCLFLMNIPAAIVALRYIDCRRAGVTSQVPVARCVLPPRPPPVPPTLPKPYFKGPPPGLIRGLGTFTDFFNDIRYKYWPKLTYVTAVIIMYPNSVLPLPEGGTLFHAFRDHTTISETIVNIHIIANAAIISQGQSISERVSQNPALSNAFKDGGTVELYFTYFFAVEMTLKLAAAGSPLKYLRTNSLHVFDLIVVIVTLFASFASFTEDLNLPNINVLRSLRLFRLFILARGLTGFQSVIQRAFGSPARLVAAYAIILFFIVLLALTGQQLSVGESFSRLNFNTFGNAFITITMYITKFGFVETLAEASNFSRTDAAFLASHTPLYDTRSILPIVDAGNWDRSISGTQYSGQLYFMAFIVAVYSSLHCVILNFVVAVVVEHYEMNELDKASMQVDIRHQISKEVQQIMRLNRALAQLDAHLTFSFEEYKFMRDTEDPFPEDAYLAVSPPQTTEGRDALLSFIPNANTRVLLSRVMSFSPYLHAVVDFCIRVYKTAQGQLHRDYLMSTCEMIPKDAKLDQQLDILKKVKSGKIRIRLMSKFENTMRLVFESSTYEIIVGVLVTSSVLLIILNDDEHPVLTDGENNVANLILIFLFTLEIALKLMTFQAIEFFASFMNWLDLFIVATMWADTFLGGLQALRSLRIIRLARSLRYLTVFQSASACMNTLSHSAESVVYILCVLILLCVMFALLALECFGGTFDFCSDSNASGFLSCFGPHVHVLPVSPDLVTPQYLLLRDPPLVTGSTSTQLPFLKPRAWQTPFLNFDTFEQCFKAVLLMSTNMYWPNIMYSAIDSTTNVQVPIQQRTQPKYESKIYNSWFFVLFQLCVSVFFIKLTSAVFINSAFEMAGGGLLTKAQRIWSYVIRVLDERVKVFISPAARPPRNWLRLKIFRTVTHPFFESGVSIAILLNLVSMLDRSYLDSSVKVNVVNSIDSVFLLLYYIEMVMRFIAIGPKSFMKDPMNIFDLFVNIMSAVDFFSDGKNGAQGFQILRAVRVLRFFKILNRFRRMRLLLMSIVVSVPFFLAAMFITIAFLILCTVVTSQYFHSIKFGRALNQAQNFRGFLPSFNTLFLAFFSGEWANLLPELAVSYPYCTRAADTAAGITDCGGESTWVFFLIFQWVCMFFITPLYLGTITCVVFQLNDVDRSASIASASSDEQDELCIVPESDYDAFFKAWELVDPGHIGLVRAWRIESVVARLVGRKIADFAPKGTKEWRQRLDHIVFQSVLATNNVKYLRESSKVKSEKDIACGFATQYVHIREVLLQMVMMVQHRCHVDSPQMQYSHWLRNATDIVSSIASKEVRGVLLDLKDDVELKGQSIFTPTPGQSKNIYEILAANIVAAARSDPEDHWLNLKSYSRQERVATHRSDFTSASELQEFKDADDVDDEQVQMRKSAHLAGLDAYAAMLMDGEGDEHDYDDIDWAALVQDEGFWEEFNLTSPAQPSNSDGHEMQALATVLQEDASQPFENPFLAEAAVEIAETSEAATHEQADQRPSGFNPMDLCASSRVDVCSGSRSNGPVGESDAPNTATGAGVFEAAGPENGSARQCSQHADGVHAADDIDNPRAGIISSDLFSVPSIFRSSGSSGQGTRFSSINPFSSASSRSPVAAGLGRWFEEPATVSLPFIRSAKQSAPAEGTATTTSPHGAAPESEPTNGHTSVFSLSSLRGSLPSVSLPSLSLPSVSLPPFFASDVATPAAVPAKGRRKKRRPKAAAAMVTTTGGAEAAVEEQSATNGGPAENHHGE